MAVNLNDERLKNVENEKNQAIQETKDTYEQMINDSDKYYQAQIDAAKEYEKTQTDLQNQQTQLTIEQINQQKEKAQKDYEKEQKGAYSDYQKATNAYGVNEEQLAAQGLNRTGYAESTRTNAYNTYQNRYATARESYNNAVLNYDNGIKEAQLANSSALAQIAYQTLQAQLKLSLEGFQYKNDLILGEMSAVNEQVDRYDNKYQQVLNQLNTEAALARSSGGGGGSSYGGYYSDDGYYLTDTTGQVTNAAGALAGAAAAGTGKVDYGSSYNEILDAFTGAGFLVSDSQKEKILANAISAGKLTPEGAQKIIDKLNK